MTDWIFGYGSLISRESRERSGVTGESLPAGVSGIRRGWYLVADEHRMTGLGAVYEEGSMCNGVVFMPESIEDFDERELKYNYTRVKVPAEKIFMRDGKPIPRGDVWAYVATEPGHPTDCCPNAQSYIDVILTGCFETGDGFAEEFIKTTHGWEHPWTNDRKNPRYPRVMESPDTERIDDALRNVLGPELNRKELFVYALQLAPDSSMLDLRAASAALSEKTQAGLWQKKNGLWVYEADEPLTEETMERVRAAGGVEGFTGL